MTTSAPTAAVLTVSDGVIHGNREDRSGESVAAALADAGFEVVRREAVPDERPEIEAALRELADAARLVVTTGGTGFGPRDVTPEATLAVLDRQAPGLAEAMRAAGRAATPLADLSRGVAGSRNEALVVNLPGSPRGAVDSLRAVLEVVPHALDLLAGHTRHGHADERPHGRHVSHPPPDEAGGGSPTGGDVLDELTRRRDAGEEVVLATAVRTEGEPPCSPGQKLLLGTGGTDAVPLAGTLGCAEFDGAAIADAPGVVAAEQPALRTYAHDRGTVEVHLEPYRRGPSLVVVGATPVGLWLLRWGGDLGYDTVLVEPRAHRVTGEHRAAAGRVAASLHEVAVDADTDAVHTDHDAPGLAEDLAALVGADARFVGLMASRRHAGQFLDAVGAAGADPAAVRAPLGLDIGSRTPQEIALSVLAGVVAAREGRDGGWMDRRP
jgi:molybdopterin adenylyltransferase